VLVKGNRMAHTDKDSTEIIDLDSETITNIDHAKKTYSVVTFQQMKEAMEEAARKAQQQQQQVQQQRPAESKTPPPEMHFKVNVTNTGVNKQVAGLSAAQSILKMSMEAKDQQSGQTGNMAITNDMWMVPEIPGYGEVRDFQERLAVKMGTMFSGPMRSMMSPSTLSAQPGMFTGMSEMAKEMSKLKGVPVSQVMRLGSTADGSPLPAASEAPLPPSNGPSAGSLAGQVASSAATSAADQATASAESKATGKIGGFGGIASGLGGFGGFHKKKQQQQQQQEQQAAAQSAAAQKWVVLMESTTETTNFSSASIDSSLFNVPAGYTKVPSMYETRQR
ncbi:MAG TPA: hypothetical protein VMT53_23790, partial [Terriglobales bacterium]|nr:hypothetical protein [Terriglobales bacterium]